MATASVSQSKREYRAFPLQAQTFTYGEFEDETEGQTLCLISGRPWCVAEKRPGVPDSRERFAKLPLGNEQILEREDGVPGRFSAVQVS